MKRKVKMFLEDKGIVGLCFVAFLSFLNGLNQGFSVVCLVGSFE